MSVFNINKGDGHSHNSINGRRADCRGKWEGSDRREGVGQIL